MNFLRSAFARIAGVFTRHRADVELRDELEAHLEMETAEYIRRGMSPDEAHRQALISSGGITQAAEAVRDQRGIPLIEGVLTDVRYAFRSLRHSPAFALVVVVTLALGIGANTAIFSVVRGVLLKPLPHRDGDRLVYLRQSREGAGGANVLFSVPEVRDYRAGTSSLAGIAEYSPWFRTLQGEHDAVRIDVGLVTGNYFEVMGLAPILGRVTRPSDDGAGVAPVIVLTHEFWLRRFGGDSGIVGQRMQLDREAVEVIGVLQPAPFFPDRMDALMNMVGSAHHVSAMMVEGRSHRMTEVVARLAPDATIESAAAEVAAVFQRAQADHPDAYDAAARQRVEVIPFRKAIGEEAQLTLWLLMAAAAFVMVISAANVVNLTLMRGVRRTQELVVRAALGAGVGRLRRLLLVENLMLALTGAALGVLVAIGGLGLLTSLAARYSPRASEIHLDLVALGFTLTLALGVALLLSWLATLPREGTLAAWIAAGVRRIAGGPRGQRLQRALVIAQVSVSVVLLAGAGLLTRTMVQLAGVDTGLTTEEVLTLPISLLDPSRISVEIDAANKERYREMQREIAALPGVVEVGLGSAMPLRASDLRFEMKADGKPLATGAPVPRSELRTADPEYFRAAGIPIVAGRVFDTTDQPGGARVVVVNQVLAEMFFPGEDPIGKRVAFTGDILRFTPFSPEWRTIVGVVGNTQDGGLDATPQAVTFLPFAQEFSIIGGLVIRADSNVAALAGQATRIVRRIAPGVPLGDVLTIRQIKDQSVSPRRLNAVLLSSFGILAVLIAAVGIAGVLAFSVSARTTEIGIRMSLGAEGAQVLRMIMREGGVLLGAGLAIGIAAAFLASRAIRGLLFGVAPHDPLTFAVVALLMGTIGLLACWIPARRASRVDPAVAMRAG